MRALVPSVLLVLTACNNPLECVEYAAFGVRAFLRDSVTNAAYTDSAVVIAREGTFADTLLSVVDSVWVGVAERAGTYRLDVSVPGYVNWSRTGIVVTQKDECHVQTTDVVVRLARP